MAVPKNEAISAASFLEWIETQDERHELVEGRVIRMMVGAAKP